MPKLTKRQEQIAKSADRSKSIEKNVKRVGSFFASTIGGKGIKQVVGGLKSLLVKAQGRKLRKNLIKQNADSVKKSVLNKKPMTKEQKNLAVFQSREANKKMKLELKTQAKEVKQERKGISDLLSKSTTRKKDLSKIKKQFKKEQKDIHPAFSKTKAGKHNVTPSGRHSEPSLNKPKKVKGK